MGNKPYQIFFPKKTKTRPNLLHPRPFLSFTSNTRKKWATVQPKTPYFSTNSRPFSKKIHTPTEIKTRPFSLHFRAPLLPTIPKKSTISAPSQKTTADTKILKNIKKNTNGQALPLRPLKQYPLPSVNVSCIKHSQFLGRWPNTQR